MIKRWKTMSVGEKLQYQFLGIFMVVGLYGLVFYPVSSKKLGESEKMLHRRKDRIQKRAKVEDLGKFNKNPKVVEKKIEEVEAQLKAVMAGFDELDTGFAPVDSSEVRQQLMLEISTLAERTGVSLLSISRKGVSPEAETDAAPLDPVLGRPLLIVKANASFGELMGFLNGLRDLSFYVSVMNLKLYAKFPSGSRESRIKIPDGRLHINLEVSM